MVMLGINKRLDKIEYRLARIDKMLEDLLYYAKGKKPPTRIEDAFIKQFESQVQQEYNRLEKKYKSVVVHKPVSESRQRKTDWYPESLAKFMLTRYRTIDDAMAKFGYTKESVRTYIKNMRKAGLPIKTRGRAPTQYKIDNPHNSSSAMQIITGAKPNG
jgi:hypothetical protein